MQGLRAAVAWLLLVAVSGCIELEIGAVPSATVENAEGASATFTWSPAKPRVGQAVTFTAVVKSSEPEDSLKSVAWSFGDGKGGAGKSTTHTYKAAGEYKVRLVAETTLSGKLGSSRDLTVQGSGPSGNTPGSQPPGAATGALRTLQPPAIAAQVDGNVVAFSFAFDAEPDVVAWEFGDGATSAEPQPRHTYLAKGEFVVTLRLLVGHGVAENVTRVSIEELPFHPRVVVGVSDTGINPYHSVYYRAERTAHPCTYVAGYTDCSIPALELSVGPDFGSFAERVARDRAVWSAVKPMTWYWIPRTTFIAVHCPEPYQGDATTTGTTFDSAICILDDTQTHGTQTTSSVLTEAPDALLVFNEGSGSAFLSEAPVPIDIESNSWGSLAPLYGGLVNGPTGQQLCHDSIDSPTSIKFRSAGNNGPVPNLGDCWRNGYRAYSVSGGYPDGTHGQLSGSMPDFASYWCRPTAVPDSVDAWEDSCGTSFAAPTAAGTAAAFLLELRRHLDYDGGSSTTHVAPGVPHEAFMDALIRAATYDPEPRDGFPDGSVYGAVTGATPWVWWGWGWLDSQVVPQAFACATGGPCPDNKSAEAWAFNDVRRAFASDGEPL